MDTTANATLAAWQPCAGCGQPVDLTVAHRTQGNYVLHDDDRCEETFDVAILRLFVDEERYQHRSKTVDRLMSDSNLCCDVCTDVHAERERAHAKHRAVSREDARWDDGQWLAVLVEEVGEVAHELTYDAHHPGWKTARSGLRAELVQVAAMATAWIDAIDRA